MSRLIDLTEQKFNRLTVIERAISPNKDTMSYWLCHCDCGNIIVVQSGKLRSSHTRSCGCLQKERVSLSIGEASFNAKVRWYKKAAKQKGREWRLSKEEVRSIIIQQCHYCGAIPTKGVSPRSSRKDEFVSNGIDRVDNNLGYILDNCVPCCEICNKMKRMMTAEYFHSHINRIYNHFYKDREIS